MAKTLKVWGGNIIHNQKQIRTIVSTYTKKRAIEIMSDYNISAYEFRVYWGDPTGNLTEIEVASLKPETVFVCVRQFPSRYVEFDSEEAINWNKR